MLLYMQKLLSLPHLFENELSFRKLSCILKVSNWATMAFFMYGGDAQYNLNPGMGDRGLMASNIGPGWYM